jgi:hypothetical protein
VKPTTISVSDLLMAAEFINKRNHGGKVTVYPSSTQDYLILDFVSIEGVKSSIKVPDATTEKGQQLNVVLTEEKWLQRQR